MVDFAWKARPSWTRFPMFSLKKRYTAISCDISFCMFSFFYVCASPFLQTEQVNERSSRPEIQSHTHVAHSYSNRYFLGFCLSLDPQLCSELIDRHASGRIMMKSANQWKTERNPQRTRFFFNQKPTSKLITELRHLPKLLMLLSEFMFLDQTTLSHISSTLPVPSWPKGVTPQTAPKPRGAGVSREHRVLSAPEAVTDARENPMGKGLVGWWLQIHPVLFSDFRLRSPWPSRGYKKAEVQS